MKDVNVSEANTSPAKNPEADLEKMYIEKYLQEKGYSPKELATLSEQDARRLMIEASQYASLKLEELEARARLHAETHDVSGSS
jgi:hypothetical protein